MPSAPIMVFQDRTSLTAIAPNTLLEPGKSPHLPYMSMMALPTASSEARPHLSATL
jgi:hypothetical protein